METSKKAAIITLALFSIIIMVEATPPGSVTAEGGNITPLYLSITKQTERWQGFPGNIIITTPFAPPNVTAYGGNVTLQDINISAPCPDAIITGYVLFSNSSSPPIGLVPGNLTQLDLFVLGKDDSATKTFTTTSSFTINGIPVANVPTTYTYVNEAPQNTKFREGYFNDGSGNIVFAVEVYIQTTGYNSSYFKYQALLPVYNTSSTLYYLSTDLTITCPVPPTGGGGGSATRGCIPVWYCAQFGPCINGMQYRNCTNRCGNYTGPPLTRICAQEEAPTEITEKEVIAEKQKQTVNITIPVLFAYLGEPFSVGMNVKNPTDYSIDDLTFLMKSAQYYQQFTALHEKPHYQEIFRLIPFGELSIQTEIKHEPETIQINPQTEMLTTITPTAPIIKPARIKANIEARTYGVALGDKEASIDINARPFKFFATKTNSRTELIIVIDNREQPKQKINVEIDYNKGRRTKFMELYTLELPENDVAMYGYTYFTPFDYDNIIGRYKSYKFEVR